MVDDEVVDIVQSLEELAAERRPDDELLAAFLPRYYADLPDDDADQRRRDDLYAAGAAHLHLGLRRPSRHTLARVMSPDLDRDGWQTQRSVLMFVTDDIPFLVDTVRMVLDRHDLGIHLLVHPTLRVVRDDDGAIASLDDDDGVVEAWTQIEIDRCSSVFCEQLEREVHAAIVEVHRVVDDFGAMQARLLALAGDDELLRWLGEQHFVFLGAAVFRRMGDRWVGEPETALGQFRDGGSLPLGEIDPPIAPDDRAVVIARTDRVSTVHRASRMVCISIRPASADVEHRFVGLFGSGAYRESVFAIPVLRDRATEILTLARAEVTSHNGRSIKNVVETLPRDVVFELDAHTLTQLVIDIVGLQERSIVRVFDVAEPVGPFTTVLVYVPRSRFGSELPERVGAIVAEQYGGAVRDLETLVSTSSLARISMTVRPTRTPDYDRLDSSIDRASETWEEQARHALWTAFGATEGEAIFERVAAATTASYRARTRPQDAVGDLRTVAAMLDDDAPSLSTSFGQAVDASGDDWRFRVYLCGRGSTIADLVPILDQLGLHAVEEHPATFAVADGEGGHRTVSLYDIGVRAGTESIAPEQRDEVERAFAGLVTGSIESDQLNRLILRAGLDTRQIAVLRLFQRYLRQVGFRFSPAYIEQVLVRHPRIAATLVELFDQRFDPAFAGSPAERADAVADVRARLIDLLDEIPALDDDRICRAFLTLIDATVRTSAFGVGGVRRDEIAVKLRPEAISFLPEPRPAFEIFVCSPYVEGVHLRGGPIARGGLRWSDRLEDFRTEVLGLVKAQMVKNAVIVPVGAKGGFVVKAGRADPADRDAVRAEGVDRYRRFVGSLLDLTDNVVEGSVERPPNIVVEDGDDPYLVVAADKGTATFSDIANELAVERGFWLGDAFASGGSQGYDHKAMGITARGAWESVRRHGRVLGVDVDRDPVTAVGVGDMSGDVFGNGMLLSTELRLVAAFDHRHIFFDPSPDAHAAHAERKRLFELPRSSWADYDTALLSSGGGVHPRSAKSIPISPEVAVVLGLDASITEMRPDEAISAILRAPVDLLWNGGIGTYIKAASESHESVGDRANDALRVDGATLRCRMIGEGGNLGVTQLGRVEYALSGGLIFTDAIDNSAGVDCSDHEVNIKIALDRLVADGELTVKQRNQLLAEMTDEVAGLVLDNNRAQTLALMIARHQSLPMVNVHARYLDSLEAEGLLDRALEFLPSDKQIAERQSAGSGLSAPEFAVLIAYTKLADIAEVLDSDVPDDPVLERDLLEYFPAAIRDRHPDAIRSHRLRREIIATSLVNSMVNLAGISFDHRMTEDTGSGVADVTRAFLAARDIVGSAQIWDEIDALGDQVELSTQISLFLEARRMGERAAGWMLRNRQPLDVGATIATFTEPIARFGESLDRLPGGRVGRDIERLRTDRIAAGVPADLAARSARWPWLHPGFDVVELALASGTAVEEAAAAYWSVFDALDVGWLWDGIGALPRSDRWQTQARSALRDDLLAVLAALARQVVVAAGGSTEAWRAANERAITRVSAMHNDIRRADSFDLTTLSVALRQLRHLVSSGR